MKAQSYDSFLAMPPVILSPKKQIGLLFVLCLLEFSSAFVLGGPSFFWKASTKHSGVSQQGQTTWSSRPGGDSNNSEEKNDEDDNDSFYRDLRQAKVDKLGADMDMIIPPDDPLRSEATKAAETEFAAAMKQARAEFQGLKEKSGGSTDAAVDEILKKLTEEEDIEASQQRQQDSDISHQSNLDQGGFE